MSMFDLTGKVAVVSGAASGMGRASALALAEHGADLLLADLNRDGVEETAARISEMGRRVRVSVGSVSDEQQIEALWQLLDQEFGRVDFLANIAGEGIMASPDSISLDQVQTVFRNLVFGRFLMCQQAGHRMTLQKTGSIVNIGSLASITALGRGHIAYSMAMGAVVQMTRELSTEWASRGIRVNAILPAQVMNPGLEKRIAENPSMKDKWLSGIPAGRMGVPDDIRGLAVLLASDASRWITGTLIPMDGGNLAMNAGGSIGR